MTQGGSKNDNGKPRLSLIPREAIEGMGAALSFGASKYSEDNFKNGISYRRLLDATLRHVYAFSGGEFDDPESKLSHIDHALASLAMLKFMMKHRPDLDDVWKPER